MTTTSLKAVALLAASLALPATAALANPVGAYYVLPAIYLATPDAKLQARHDFGLQLSVGTYLSEVWQAELISEATRFKRKGGADTINQRGASLQTIYSPIEDAGLKPILIGGFGWLHSSGGSVSENRPVTRLGLGLQSSIPNSSFGIRASATWRHEFNSAFTAPASGVNTVLYSLGLSYRFGRDTPAFRATDENAISTGHQTGQQENTSSAEKEPSSGHTGAQNDTPENQDQDGDGIPDAQDKCSDTPSDMVVDADGCPLRKK